MTRKDYNKLANIILDAKIRFDPQTAEFIAEEMADTLKADNPNFDRRRFLSACDIPTEAWT